MTKRAKPRKTMVVYFIADEDAPNGAGFYHPTLKSAKESGIAGATIVRETIAAPTSREIACRLLNNEGFSFHSEDAGTVPGKPEERD